MLQGERGVTLITHNQAKDEPEGDVFVCVLRVAVIQAVSNVIIILKFK